MKLYKVSGGGETFYTESLKDIREYFGLSEFETSVYLINQALEAQQNEVGGYLYQVSELEV